MNRYLVLDYYVDEPACFGVPPYISPYIRYTWGAIKTADPGATVDYLTVDELRLSDFKLEENEYNAVFLIAGATVPGRYLGGKIGSLSEIKRFAIENKKLRTHIYVGGPAQYLSPAEKESFDELEINIVKGDIEKFAEIYVSSKGTARPAKAERSYDDVKRYAVSGAGVAHQHFRNGYLIAEIETYRGCTRTVYCSFCTEIFYGRPRFRPLEDIFEEVKALYDAGITAFRLGRQADLYTYNADMSTIRNSFPRPRPEQIEVLYAGIRKMAPGLEVLHLDNTNPGLIATFPHESEQITRIIAGYNTSADTAAMGVESVDSNVIQANDLKASQEQVEQAIGIIDRYGSIRKNGMPALSPGLNFIGGLPGETEKTFELNYRFLEKLLEQKVIIRRLNIRQALTFDRTKMAQLKRKNATRHGKLKRQKNRFDFYKKQIREKIDPAMLQLAFPKGTLIPGVILEKRVPHGFLGRPLGSYPITCHVLASDRLLASDAANDSVFGPYTKLDVVVTGYKERAVYAVAVGDIPTLPNHVWQKIAGRSIADLIFDRGFADAREKLPHWLKKNII